MKRQIRYTLTAAALIALCLASGCGKKKEKIDLTNTQAAPSQAETMAKETAAPEKEVTIEKNTAEEQSPAKGTLADKIPTQTYANGSVSVKYPEVIQVDDSALASQINETLKTHALAVLKAYEINEDTDTVDISYRPVSADRNRFSVVYTGTINKKGAAYPINVFYTDTIDLKSGKSLSLKDYADPYTLAGYVLSNDCFFVSESGGLTADHLAALMNSRTGLTIDQYTKMFKGADFPGYDAKNGSLPETFSYEDSDSIIFSIPVPHALGDYALISFTPEGK